MARRRVASCFAVMMAPPSACAHQSAADAGCAGMFVSVAPEFRFTAEHLSGEGRKELSAL